MKKADNQRFADKAKFDPFLYLMEIGMDAKQPQSTRVAVAMELLPYMRAKVRHSRLETPLGIPKGATPAEAAALVLSSVDDGLIPMEQGVMMLGMIEKAAGFSYAKEMEEMRLAILALQAPDGQAVNGPTPLWLRMKNAQQTHEGNDSLRPAE